MATIDPKAAIKATVAEVTVAEHDGSMIAVAVAYVTKDGKAHWSFGYGPGSLSIPLLGAIQCLQSDVDKSIKRERTEPT